MPKKIDPTTQWEVTITKSFYEKAKFIQLIPAQYKEYADPNHPFAHWILQYLVKKYHNKKKLHYTLLNLFYAKTSKKIICSAMISFM